jgi:hypothetical protein
VLIECDPLVSCVIVTSDHVLCDVIKDRAVLIEVKIDDPDLVGVFSVNVHLWLLVLLVLLLVS